MKIAIVTDDGLTIADHFGRARGFVVVTVENGQEIAREVRARAGCCQGEGQHDHGHGHDHHHHGEGHGCAANAELVTDCDVLLARRMGGGPYRALVAAGVRTVFTDQIEVDEAMTAFLAGGMTSTKPQLCH